MTRTISALAAVALLATGCTSDPPTIDAQRVQASPAASPRPGATPEPKKVRTASARLERFDSCPRLLGHIKTEAARIVGPWGLGGYAIVADVAAMEAGAATSGGDRAAPAPTTDYSTTNVQVEGVDEPDVAKTDGRRIFTVGNGKLHALVIRDGVARRANSIAIEGGWAQELLLDGDRVLVFAGTSGVALPADMSAAVSEPVREASRSNVVVVDVSDPAAMRVVSTISLEGDYVSARLADGRARIVVRSGTARIAWEVPERGTEAEMAQALEANKALIRRSTIEQWLPTAIVRSGTKVRAVPQATCGSTYRPQGFSGMSMVSVVTIDPDDPQPRAGTSVLAEAGVVYASARSLYVATNRWDVAAGGPALDFAPTSEATEIHRFDISGTQARYDASGRVPGRVLNQFSLDEHGSYLRVATTTDGDGRNQSSSAVRVLAARQGALVEVGEVGGLGEGEQIFAVRFMGDVAYVVTFRRIDPLYVIDLRNPLRPRVAGELKIPGYSAYLHPVGEGRLLGVGQDATDEGTVTGTQVSLFDTTDPASPTRMQTFKLAGGSSEIEFDHHAFLWWAPRKMAVLPTQIWSEGAEPFVGAVAVEVDGSAGIREIGRVSHVRDGAEPSKGADEAYVSSVPIRRAIVVGDGLFTVSDAGVLSSELGSFDERGWALLR